MDFVADWDRRAGRDLQQRVPGETPDGRVTHPALVLGGEALVLRDLPGDQPGYQWQHYRQHPDTQAWVIHSEGIADSATAAHWQSLQWLDQAIQTRAATATMHRSEEQTDQGPAALLDAEPELPWWHGATAEEVVHLTADDRTTDEQDRAHAALAAAAQQNRDDTYPWPDLSLTPEGEPGHDLDEGFRQLVTPGEPGTDHALYGVRPDPDPAGPDDGHSEPAQAPVNARARHTKDAAIGERARQASAWDADQLSAQTTVRLAFPNPPQPAAQAAATRDGLRSRGPGRGPRRQHPTAELEV